MTDFRVRLDPWEPDYEAAIQVSPDQEPANVDLEVELGAWAAIKPSVVSPPQRIFFIDGVRRIEHRILVEQTEKTCFGLFGSFAVGATRIDGTASIVEENVERLCVVGGGLEANPWTFRLPAGNSALTFDALAVAENTPEAAVDGLHNSMREREAALAQSLSVAECLVFLDGPLSFFTATKLPVIGFVKRLQRMYLPAENAPLLRTLGIGERTPIFLIKDTRHSRYSWYGRIGSGRTIDSSLTGIVRLECSSSLDLQTVRRLADVSAVILPRFASARGRDPRAPQNLYPIGGLEAALRHRLGDQLIIRRAIETHLHNLESPA